MIVALRWLWRHWYVPIIALGSIAGFVFGMRARCPSPLALAKNELVAIDAGEQARLLAVRRSTAAATAAADILYRKELDALDAKQKKKASSLRRDPARRARFLARLSRRRPTDII